MPNLLRSGLWRGFYEQHGRRYRQEQTMEFADGHVRGEGSDEVGPFRIEGQYDSAGDAVRLGWIKTYEAGHSVLYLGAFDGTWIEGAWELEGYPGDGFGFCAPGADPEAKTGRTPRGRRS